MAPRATCNESTAARAGRSDASRSCTDTYDTIDWLVKNTPESNGKVGHSGDLVRRFTPLIGVSQSTPALKVSVAMNPMVDGWMGDDWFITRLPRTEHVDIYEQ